MRVCARLLGVNCFFEYLEWALRFQLNLSARLRAFPVLQIGSVVAFWHHKYKAVLKTSVQDYDKNYVTNSVLNKQEKVDEMWNFRNLKASY